jgi:hypothetical protein
MLEHMVKGPGDYVGRGDGGLLGPGAAAHAAIEGTKGGVGAAPRLGPPCGTLARPD